MTKRLNYFVASPQAMEILHKQETYLREQFSKDPSLTISLWELVKLRISQVNQYAYCIDMHYKDAIERGESTERLYGLSAWQDMPYYSPAEECALQWSELITAGQPVNDVHYQHALDTFGEQGLTNLTIAVNSINSWNRICKAFKPEVGSYKAS